MTNESPPDRIIIVGAGQAGSTAASCLRQSGYAGEILLIGEEAIAPYQRPPLSKAYLKGEVGADHLKLRPDSYYEQRNIKLRTGSPVQKIDRTARTVTVDGVQLPYDALILATGSRPRPIPSFNVEMRGIHQLRTLADTDTLKTGIKPGSRLLVIGGGYIGLEVAASARAQGAEVVLLEREARCMARVACPQISEFFEKYHRRRGVDIRTGTRIVRFTSDASGAVSGMEIEGGEVIPCDLALIGIGVQPCEELAVAAGITCNDGILVDIEARTSDPHIFAIGDVTRRPMPVYGGRLFRLESVANAAEQAKQAAAAILGEPAPTPEVPWFWSDQYDLKLQIAGIPFDADEIVARGDPQAAAFSTFHLQNRRIVAVETVNAAVEFMIGKRLIAARLEVDPERLADTAVPMKRILESSSGSAAAVRAG